MITSTASKQPAPANQELELRLYVAGQLPNSVLARENLRRICEDDLHGNCRVEVVDFLESPQRALADGVLVTPTLLMVAPSPQRIIVGTLADRATVLRALDVADAP
jgi:circadian clock protein KaiB